jgi:dolichol-phosphate mannosyltransferase
MTIDSDPTAERRNPPELAVVIPVYNEQDSIGKVIEEWIDELDGCCENFVVLAIDDGSRDRSLDVLRGLQERFGSRLLATTQPNRGHGQTCLEGYRHGIAMGARYLFQIDSDGQCDPRYFRSLWRIREQFTVVYGVRKTRDDGWMRVLISRILGLMLRWAFRANCPDANVPYRLMQADAVAGAIDRIPADFHLANVALAVLLARDKSCSHGFVPIGFRKRYGGQSSVSPLMFGRKAVALHRQIRKMLREGEVPRK